MSAYTEAQLNSENDDLLIGHENRLTFANRIQAIITKIISTLFYLNLRTLKSFYTNVSLLFNAATDFYSITIPAATFANNGDSIQLEYWIEIPASGNDAAGTLQLYFGGFSILSQSLVSIGTYKLSATIIRVDATTVRVVSSPNVSQTYAELTVSDLSSNATIVKGKMTTTATATVNSNARMGLVKFYPKEA